jgi:uncharacterized protein (TIGR02147 family)
MDYRLFLKDWFEAKRKTNPQWTYGAWARLLRLKSPATLNMILNGKRNPSPKLTTAISKQLGLRGSEVSYFEDLVKLEKSKNDASVSVLLLERINKKNPSGILRVLDREQFYAISNWYYYAIRELVDVRGFLEDPEWISRKLRHKVTNGQIQKAIKSLLALNLLIRDEQGILRYGGGAVRTADDLSDEGLKRFHEETLQSAALSVRSVDPKDREISGYTFTLNRERLPEAKDIIRRMHRELLTLAEKQDAESVYQIETVLFPLTHFDKEGHEKL